VAEPHRTDPLLELFHRLLVVGRVAEHDAPVANIGARAASTGFSPPYIGADDLPTICTLPMG